MDMRIPLAFAVANAPGMERDRTARPMGLALVIALHVALVAALLLHTPVRQTLAKAAPVMVHLIALESPPPIVPPKPVVAKLAPRVAPPRTLDLPPAPVIAPQVAAPAMAALPPALVTPDVPRNDAPVVIAASTAAPAETVAPRFDAAYLDNPPPAYPPLARRAGEQGKVLLRVHVTADGLADDVQIRESSGFPRLDAAAQETVRRWRFVPARQGDRNVAAWVIVPIAFTLAR
ncbi:MAG: energy transducer TonB [Burkholderiales bacterium]